ncbi:unnamed protein product [Rhizophagus irregularis]|nr:unnamed protein product [Rhizophagus irregularis]
MIKRPKFTLNVKQVMTEVSRNSTFTPTPLLYVSHPAEVIYHGRLLEFNNLSKPNKANRRSKLPSSLPYSVIINSLQFF